MVAALLLLASQFATVVSVDVATGSCEALNDTDPTLAERCVQGGFERHGPAFALLAALVLAMALWADRNRAAAVGLIALGLVALSIALFNDLPASQETGVIGRDYEGAQAKAGAGLWLEAAGGALAVLAGLVALVPRREDRVSRHADGDEKQEGDPEDAEVEDAKPEPRRRERPRAERARRADARDEEAE